MFAFCKSSGSSPDDLSKVTPSSVAVTFCRLSQHPWMESLWSHGLVRVEFAQVTPDLTPTHCWLISMGSASRHKGLGDLAEED